MEQKKKPARVAPSPHPSGRGPVIAVIVAALVAALLLLPCILASSSTTIFPRTTVAGIGIGGLSQQAAQALLEKELPATYEATTLPVTVKPAEGSGAEEQTFEILLSDIHIQADAAQAAADAYAYGRADNFFVRGVNYAQALILGHNVVPNLSMDEAELTAEIAEIAEQADIPVTECSWSLKEDSLEVIKPKSGYLIDRSALLGAISDAIGNYDLDGVTCTPEEAKPLAVTMEDVHADAACEASNPYYDKASGSVKDGKPGVEFSAAEAQKRMDEAKDGETFSVPVTLTKSSMTREEMASKLFRDTLGTCTTNVGGNGNRKHNVSKAAQSCNGVILNPGEEFSYNATLGQRTAANGYLQAGAYVGGKTVSEYGGGICQISSTLYLAALRSNLQIVSRTNHMFFPGYTPYGMDATVSWGGPDLKFRNNTDYPIKIKASYGGGKATCTIIGTNIDGTSVKMEYDVLSTIPFKTVEKTDNSLQPGQRVRDQSGYTGYKVATYRCVYDKNGNLISRNKEATSNYRSRDVVYRVGPAAPVKPPEPEKPAPKPETPAPKPETPPTPPAPETPAPGTPAPSDAA